MDRFLRILGSAWAWSVDLLRSWLGVLIPALVAPRVGRFSPLQGWPGSIISVQGRRFGVDRDHNTVTIGGERALVLRASATELRVLAGDAKRSSRRSG